MLQTAAGMNILENPPQRSRGTDSVPFPVALEVSNCQYAPIISCI